MVRAKRARGGLMALAATLVIGASAVAGCKAGANAGAPIHLSKTNVPAQAGQSPSVSDSTPPPVSSSPPRAPSAPPAARPVRPADPVLLRTGESGAKVRELQARLRQLHLFGRNPTGYYGSVTTASVKSFQGRQGMARTGVVTSSAWSALGARTSDPSHDALHPPTTLPLGKPDARCLTGRAVCVSKKSRALAWYANGKRLMAMDVRFGSAYTPTREGRFKVDFKSRHHVSTIYHTPMPYALFFSGGQAIHYSSDFAARGYRGASHGCVNVRDKKKIAALFAQVRAGDKVIVYG
jgi:peptidoglycan hydrolase-like protein with peptidoglycan-binding domain